MTDYHFISGIVLFLSSAIGCTLPFLSKTDLSLVRPLSTGVVFAVALCHLLADASDILDSKYVTDLFANVTGLRGGDLNDVLPVAEWFMCLGIFIMLVIDQWIPCHHHMHFPIIEKGCKVAESNQTEKDRLLSASKCCTLENSSYQKQEVESVEEGNGIANGIANDHAYLTYKQSMTHSKIYATEAAIAIHSIIIGFTIGINPDTSALMGFTFAMIFHQVFEGAALAMMAVQGKLGTKASCILVAMFSFSLPFGILIGLFVYNFANDDGEDVNIGSILFQGIPNALAAGMLIHIGFELMMDDFSHSHHNQGKFPKGKLSLVFLGGLAMCFLAIWA